MAYNLNVVTKNPITSNHNLIGHRIDQGRLEFVSVLGLGAYGVVYLARDLTSADLNHPNMYAVKVLNKIGLDARQKSFQRREIALHSLASHHPSIVTLHAVIESTSCTFVVLDYCPDGDLFGMITEKKRYLGRTDAIKAVFIQIVEAVEFCHCLGISHRDLKPENILCKNNGNTVVLADFGLATIEKTSSDFGCGSTFYMSPECQGGLYERLGSYSTFQNDIWSLGVILVNLTCGRNPWKQAGPSDETFRAYLANPDFLRSILPISEACNSLLKRIFSPNPLSRISLEELKVEISRIETFDMSWVELSRASKATREAARAWRSDVPPSPKLELFSSASSGDAKNSTYSVKSPEQFVCNLANRKPTGVRQPNRQASASKHRSLLANPQLHPRICLNQSKSSLDSSCSHVKPPAGTLVSDSSPPSTSQPSSPLSNQLPTRRGFLSSRLLKLSNAALASSKDVNQPSNIRKKKLAGSMGFTHPTAPSPIVVNQNVTTSGASPVSSIPKSSAASPREGYKHSIYNCLPFTPPPSASPSKATFGFLAKHSRFFHLSSNSIQPLPPTPLTSNHYAKFGLSSTSSPSALV